VAPVALPIDDPLARIDGVLNGLHVETDTVSPVTVVGPGAGPEQAGQGVFADLAAVIAYAR
jgi:homoserine dehydrogenase